MKYMGVIQALWFKTCKRRRANASVVKSYLDLYQHSIPELLETIVNLSDEEVRVFCIFQLSRCLISETSFQRCFLLFYHNHKVLKN